MHITIRLIKLRVAVRVPIVALIMRMIIIIIIKNSQLITNIIYNINEN